MFAHKHVPSPPSIMHISLCCVCASNDVNNDVYLCWSCSLSGNTVSAFILPANKVVIENKNYPTEFAGRINPLTVALSITITIPFL